MSDSGGGATQADAAVADHSDILEDDDAELEGEAPLDAGLPSGADLGAASPSSDAADGAAGAGEDPAADVRATLGNVASGLAEQLTSITEEMNKIRSELYGDSGIGGIAKELEKLKSGGLGGLLDTSALDGLDAALGDDAGRRPQARSSGAAASGAASVDEAARRRRGGGNGSSGSDDRSVDRKAELEALQRKLMARNKPQKKEPSVSFWEKLMLLFLVLVCLYIGSPFFRTSVKKAFYTMVGGSLGEEEEEEFFD